MNDCDNCRHNTELGVAFCGPCQRAGRDEYPGWEPEQLDPVPPTQIETLPEYLHRTAEKVVLPDFVDHMNEQLRDNPVATAVMELDRLRHENNELRASLNYCSTMNFRAHRLVMSFCKARKEFLEERCAIAPWSSLIENVNKAEKALVEYWEKHREGGQ